MDRIRVIEGMGMVIYLEEATRDLRINGRWLQGCRDKMTDYFPAMLIEEGKTTYWNHVKFIDSSFTHIIGNSVRMRSHGEAVCY